MSVIMKAKYTLTSLSISSFKHFKISSLKKISEITKLTKLEINASNFKENDEFFQIIDLLKVRSLKIHHHLPWLDFLHHYGGSLGRSLVRLALSCPELEHLDISGCLLTDLKIKEPDFTEFLCIASQARLKHLDIRDCEFDCINQFQLFIKNMKLKYPQIKIVDNGIE